MITSMKTTIFILFLIVYALYTFYEAPFSSHFCKLYKKSSTNKYAELIKKLNEKELCPSKENDIFDKYIYWNHEIIAGVKNNILVFKGSDTIKDLFYDLTTSFTSIHQGRTLSNIQLIYNKIKNKIKSALSLYNIDTVIGWSLGSVLACIAAHDNHENIKKIVCFGFPNIFSDRFKENYNKLLGDKTTIYNSNLDIFANLFGYGKLFTQIKTTKWINVSIINLYKLLTNGLGYYHMSYFD